MQADGLPDADSGRPNITHDAVVVIPGIMGSELVERPGKGGRDGAGGRVLWGLRDLRWLALAWSSRSGLADLALTDAELDQLADGRYDPKTARVQATGLLRFPAAVPFLGGFEPYTPLVRRLTRAVAHPDAVLPFGYDWRLPVEFNARALAEAARNHLAGWREHPAQEQARRNSPDDRLAQLVLVAHSMGGLLARGLGLIPGGTDDVRLTITLGTPFYGSVKAAVLLNSGAGAPLPHRRLQQVAATLPGVHDLLPTSRCLLTTATAGTGNGAEDVVRVTDADVAALGGNQDLARAAFAYHERLESVALVGHRALVGTAQPTLQSMTLTDGVVRPAQRSYLWHDDGDLKRDRVGQLLYRDHRGDGTVHRYAAVPIGQHATGLPQSHGALAASSEAGGAAADWTVDLRERGIRLGAGDLGLEVPDLAATGEPVEVVVTGETDAALVSCTVTELEAGGIENPVARPTLAARRDGGEGFAARFRPDRPGLYRVSVTTGGRDPVTQIVICAAADPSHD